MDFQLSAPLGEAGLSLLNALKVSISLGFAFFDRQAVDARDLPMFPYRAATGG